MSSSSIALPALLVAAVLFVVSWLYRLFTPPANFPKNIPTIPFYYTLLPLFKDVDQEELYRQYLQRPLTEYGAVKIFFGNRWNILVQRPTYLAEVLRYEDTFAKSGNQKKIPHSVIASYTGDNVISAHGDAWRAYAAVIKPGLQEDVSAEPIYRNTTKLVDILLDEQSRSTSGTVAVMQPLQRYVLANLAECLLGTSFQVRTKY